VTPASKIVTVYLGLGTNLGSRLENLQSARAALPPQVIILRASQVYETPPWGYTAQPSFLNQVVEAQTHLSPRRLLAHLKSIERRLGRAPTFRYGPRLIDIDILFFGGQVFDLHGLIIPHPRLAERAFVLVPLAELAPDLVHPRTGLSVRQLLTKVDANGVEIYHG
jgi:2-amino-4-hydroxy-6-hydroxymethyldihydropteridine diphosphokinase